MNSQKEKELSGTDRADRADHIDVDGSFPELLKIAPAPSFFNDEQKKYYRKIAKLLFETGLLKRVDQMAIEQLAITCYNFEEATKELNTNGFTNKHDQVSPYYTMQQASMKSISDFSRRYGLSISDRSKLVSVNKTDPNQLDVFETHLNSLKKVV